MIRLVLLLSLFLSGLACAGAGQRAAQPTPTPVDDKAVPADTVVTLERTPCFGTCPSYKVTVYGDGRLVYEGRKFVKVEGKVESNVTREQVGQLLAEFEKANYFSLRDLYNDVRDGCPTYWTDSPSADTSLQVGGRSKAVAHYYGCMEKGTSAVVYPRELYHLESRIDEILDTARWVKGEGGEPRR